MEKLIKGANLAIQSCSLGLLDDLAESQALESANEELSKALHLKAISLFAILEITSIAKAMMACNTVYAKRYHNKNLKAYTSECFKMIYNFGNVRKRSVWSKFAAVVDKLGDSSLRQQYVAITSDLILFGDKQIDEDLRGVTLHYDYDMLKVYDKTVAHKSEADAIQYYLDFQGLLIRVQTFTDKVIDVMKVGVSIPNYTISCPNLLGTSKLDDINKNNRLKEAVTLSLTKGPEQLDVLVRTQKGMKSLMSLVQTKSAQLGIVDINSFLAQMQVPIDLGEIHILQRQIYLDIAAVCEAVYNSVNTFEASLNLRRLVIHQAAMMDHLYGYNTDQRNVSQWVKIGPVIPVHMANEKNVIESFIQILVPLVDKNKRHRFVHLYDKKGRVDLQTFITSIDRLNFNYELGVSTMVFQLYHMLLPFVNDVMNDLCAKQRKETEESSNRLNSMLAQSVSLINLANLDEENKQRMRGGVERIKNVIDGVDKKLFDNEL